MHCRQIVGVPTTIKTDTCSLCTVLAFVLTVFVHIACETYSLEDYNFGVLMTQFWVILNLIKWRVVGGVHHMCN